MEPFKKLPYILNSNSSLGLELLKNSKCIVLSCDYRASVFFTAIIVVKLLVFFLF